MYCEAGLVFCGLWFAHTQGACELSAMGVGRSRDHSEVFMLGQWRKNLHAALLTLLLPGLGQLIQGKRARGIFFLAWSGLTLMALFSPWPRSLVFGELVVLTVWAVGDALFAAAPSGGLTSPTR